jgi:hypothetical protein
MMLKFHPDKVPILLNRVNKSQLKNFDNNKYSQFKFRILILKTFSIFKLIMIIKKKLQLGHTEAIYLFANNTLLHAEQTLEEVYRKYAS